MTTTSPFNEKGAASRSPLSSTPNRNLEETKGAASQLSGDNARIVAFLRNRGQRGCTSREFPMVLGVLNYTARIDELRNRHGFGIEAVRLKTPGPKAVWHYTLTSDPEAEPQGALFDTTGEPEGEDLSLNAIAGEAA